MYKTLILCTIKEYDMLEKVLERMRNLMNNGTLTIEELSEKTGLTARYLKALKKGTKNNPALDTIYKIAIAYGLDIMDLIKE